jgi:hypothetical protein
MTSADKVYENSGKAWSPRKTVMDPDEGLRISQPLDFDQGAGRVNALEAYNVYARHTSKATPVATWMEGRLRGTQSYTLNLGHLIRGEHLDTALTWLRHVIWTDSNHNGRVDGQDNFTAASLADFCLTLAQGRHAVVTSDSDSDNAEYLSWRIPESGDYSLVVHRFSGSGYRRENFALAARVLAAPSSSKSASLSAATLASSLAPAGETGSLKGWIDGQSAATGSLSAAGAVPEPGSLVALTMLAGTLAFRRRRG